MTEKRNLKDSGGLLAPTHPVLYRTSGCLIDIMLVSFTVCAVWLLATALQVIFWDGSLIRLIALLAILWVLRILLMVALGVHRASASPLEKVKNMLREKSYRDS